MTDDKYEVQASGTSKIMRTAEILERCKTQDLPFAIKEYVTSSGAVLTYTGVQYLKEGGYHDLVRQSLDWLAASEDELRETSGIEDTATLERAIAEQRASWHKTLDGGHGKTYKAPSEDAASDSGAYLKYDDKPMTLVIKNLETIGPVLEHDEQPAVKSPVSTLAQAKAYIRSQAPLSRYVGQLNLSPDKFGELVVEEN
jgi:hypothetical protein